jgi:hypothetical protein
MHNLLYLMFGPDAFVEGVDLDLTHRQICSDFEIDFCSTLHVHPELRIRDRPVELMKKLKFLRGCWKSWLRKIVPVSSSHEGPGCESPQSNLTDVMTSVRATHYIVCETKISEGKASVEGRLSQLERNLKKLCERKGAASEQAALKAVEIIALAGLGVPYYKQFDVSAIRKKIQKSQDYPVLQALLQEERVFILEVDSFSLRLEKLELGQERQEKVLNKVEQSQKRQEKLLQKILKTRNQAGNESQIASLIQIALKRLISMWLQ